MTVEIVVPTLGESVTEATVAKWLKNVGDSVNKTWIGLAAGPRTRTGVALRWIRNNIC